MSSEKTTVGGTIKLLLVVALVIGGWNLYASRGDRDVKPQRPGVDEDISENITISVTTKPARRPENPTHVIVTVEDVKVIEEFMTRSPLNGTFRIPKGANVKLSAEQRQPGIVDCIIQSNGKVVDVSGITDTGTAWCEHNKKRR